MSDKIREKIGEIDPGFWEKVKEFFANLLIQLNLGLNKVLRAVLLN